MSGKRERPADFQLDEKTLEYKQIPKEDRESRKATPEQIAARKIYKIKHSSQQTQHSTSKPKFTLFGNNNQQQPKFQLAQTTNQKQKKQSEQASKGQQANNKEDQKKQKTFTAPVFGNFFSNFKSQGGLGIFGKSTLDQNKPSLGQGLFSRKSSEKSDSIFKTGFTNSNSKTQSIFGFTKQGVPPIRKQNEQQKIQNGGDEGDSAELEKQQNLSIDPNKSSGKYQYPQECEVLFKSNVTKMKKRLEIKKGEKQPEDSNDNDLLENLEVILQKDKSKGHVWLIIKLMATKNTIISGLVMKGISEVKNINNKDQNVCISIFTLKQKKSNEPQKFDKYILKIQFQQASLGRKLINLINQL